MKGFSMKKNKWTLIYIVLNIFIIVLIGFMDPEIKDLDKIFGKVKPAWLVVAVATMVVFWIMDGAILSYGIKLIYRGKSFWKCFKISIIGQYYNAITPFASGGQPAQVYYMNMIGIPGGSASSILMIKFLIYQIVLSIFSTVAIVWKGMTIYNFNSWVFWFSIVGFVINAGAIILLVFLSIKKGFVQGLVYKIIDMLSRIKLIKNSENTKKKLKSHVEDFHHGMKLMQDNLKGMLLMGFMTGIQLICFFSITFFIYMALGLKGESWPNIIFVQALLYLAVSFIPTPGAMGASETGFMAFFRLFFPSNLIFVAMLLWRIISYYLNILSGILVILFDSIKYSVSGDNVSYGAKKFIVKKHMDDI